MISNKQRISLGSALPYKKKKDLLWGGARPYHRRLFGLKRVDRKYTEKDAGKEETTERRIGTVVQQ